MALSQFERKILNLKIQRIFQKALNSEPDFDPLEAINHIIRVALKGEVDLRAILRAYASNRLQEQDDRLAQLQTAVANEQALRDEINDGINSQ